jgi:hypothetical protein
MEQSHVCARRSMAWPYSSPSCPAPHGTPFGRLQGLTAAPGNTPESLSRMLKIASSKNKETV